MMRKLVILLTLLMLTISSICQAFEQPDPTRWIWLGSDDKIGLWLDKDTFRLEKIKRSISHDGHNSANIWIQAYDAVKDQTVMQNFICDFDCKSIATASIIVYNSKKELIDNYNSTYTSFTPTVPGSIGEWIYISAENFKQLKEAKQ